MGIHLAGQVPKPSLQMSAPRVAVSQALLSRATEPCPIPPTLLVTQQFLANGWRPWACGGHAMATGTQRHNGCHPGGLQLDNAFDIAEGSALYVWDWV